MKIISSAIIIVGVVFLALSFAVPSTLGYTQGGTTYTWSLQGSISTSSTNIQAGTSVTLTADVTGFSATTGAGGTSLTFFANGNNVASVSTIAGTGTYTAKWTPTSPGSYTITAKYLSGFSTDSTSIVTYSTFGGSISTNVLSSKPTIANAYATPNPVIAGNTTAFTASVSWNGNTGTLNWSVSGGTSISGGSGNTFLFTSAGTYSVTATATNEYGSATYTFTLNVTASQVVKNVGTFYVRLPSGTLTKLTSTTNIVLKFSSYPANLTMYYVENNGNTTNMDYAYVTLNGNQVKLSTPASVNGNAAYMGSITFNNEGSYTLSGYIEPSFGAASVQVFSITGSTSGTSGASTSLTTFNAPLFYIGVFVLIAGGVVRWRFNQ